jgi:glyoxylase-like metal-dependent hydrolase (beta-lactamase superfamily II)
MKVLNGLYWYPEGGIMDCNSYLFQDETCILIDPGIVYYLPNLIDGLREDGIDPNGVDAVINTHFHPDHAGANRAFIKKFGAKLMAYNGTRKSGVSGYFGDELRLNHIKLEVIHTPGHSPDSLSFYWREEKVLICGDLIFDRGVGRVDTPGGSGVELKRSIEEISKLEIEYLLPGHGEILWGRVNIDNNFDFIRSVYFGLI